MPKLSKLKDAQKFVPVENLCIAVSVRGRKRISHSTANNWIRALMIQREYKLGSDGKYYACVRKEDGKRFIHAYKARKEFRVIQR